MSTSSTLPTSRPCGRVSGSRRYKPISHKARNPSGSTLLPAWTKRRPRCDVRHALFSTSLKPWTIAHAHGCATVNARGSSTSVLDHIRTPPKRSAKVTTAALRRLDRPFGRASTSSWAFTACGPRRPLTESFPAKVHGSSFGPGFPVRVRLQVGNPMSQPSWVEVFLLFLSSVRLRRSGGRSMSCFRL